MAGRRGPVLFRERDISRAFRAAKTAGVSIKVDIAPDGSLSLVPMEAQPQVETVPKVDMSLLKAWD
jgi:hypothetical protein